MIITLTSDFGLRDAYVGIMKGVILSICPDAHIVDLSHGIYPQSIEQAAFVIKNAYGYFPQGSIHVSVVDPGVGTDRVMLLVLAGGHTFLAPDNGLLKYIFHSHAEAQVYKLTNPAYFLKPICRTFHGRDIFAPIAAHIANGVRPEALGERVAEFVRGTIKRPIVTRKTISGEILYIDGFGNAVTNIEGAQLNISGENTIIVKKNAIVGLCQTYAERDEGKPLVLIGSHGNLEIAINKGSAGKALRLRSGDAITVHL